MTEMEINLNNAFDEIEKFLDRIISSERAKMDRIIDTDDDDLYDAVSREYRRIRKQVSGWSNEIMRIKQEMLSSDYMIVALQDVPAVSQYDAAFSAGTQNNYAAIDPFSQEDNTLNPFSLKDIADYQPEPYMPAGEDFTAAQHTPDSYVPEQAAAPAEPFVQPPEQENIPAAQHTPDSYVPEQAAVPAEPFVQPPEQENIPAAQHTPDSYVPEQAAVPAEPFVQPPETETEFAKVNKTVPPAKTAKKKKSGRPVLEFPDNNMSSGIADSGNTGSGDVLRSISEYVRMCMKNLEQSGFRFSANILTALCSAENSKRLFDIGQPFFSDEYYPDGYFREPFRFNGQEYYLVSFWNEKSCLRFDDWYRNIRSFPEQSAASRKPEKALRNYNKPSADRKLSDNDSKLPDNKPLVDSKLPGNTPPVDSKLPDNTPPVDSKLPDNTPPVDSKLPDNKPPVDSKLPDNKPPVDSKLPDNKPSVDSKLPDNKPSDDTKLPDNKPSVDSKLPDNKPSDDIKLPDDKPSAVGNKAPAVESEALPAEPKDAPAEKVRSNPLKRILKLNLTTNRASKKNEASKQDAPEEKADKHRRSSKKEKPEAPKPVKADDKNKEADIAKVSSEEISAAKSKPADKAVPDEQKALNEPNKNAEKEAPKKLKLNIASDNVPVEPADKKEPESQKNDEKAVAENIADNKKTPHEEETIGDDVEIIASWDESTAEKAEPSDDKETDDCAEGLISSIIELCEKMIKLDPYTMRVLPYNKSSALFKKHFFDMRYTLPIKKPHNLSNGIRFETSGEPEEMVRLEEALKKLL